MAHQREVDVVHARPAHACAVDVHAEGWVGGKGDRQPHRHGLLDRLARPYLWRRHHDAALEGFEALALVESDGVRDGRVVQGNGGEREERLVQELLVRHLVVAGLVVHAHVAAREPFHHDGVGDAGGLSEYPGLARRPARHERREVYVKQGIVKIEKHCPDHDTSSHRYEQQKTLLLCPVVLHAK